ncbi:MAG: hypothetical protein ACXWB9_05210 [Flavisolibacter sp.]
MKSFMFLLAASLLLSFTGQDNKEIDGIWIGYYQSDILKEKLIVKFSTDDKMEFYVGGVDEPIRCVGSYRILGDSVSFTYKDAEGFEIRMRGHLNYMKTSLDGVWKNDIMTGKFHLKKQKVEERMTQP